MQEAPLQTQNSITPPRQDRIVGHHDCGHPPAALQRFQKLDYLPFAVPVRDLVVIVSVTLAWALACSFYGALRAARLDAMAALRA